MSKETYRLSETEPQVRSFAAFLAGKVYDRAMYINSTTERMKTIEAVAAKLYVDVLDWHFQHSCSSDEVFFETERMEQEIIQALIGFRGSLAEDGTPHSKPD